MRRFFARERRFRFQVVIHRCGSLCLHLLTPRESALVVLRQGRSCCLLNCEHIAQANSNEFAIEPNNRNFACADLSLNDFDVDVPPSGDVVVGHQDIGCRCSARFGLRSIGLQSNFSKTLHKVFGLGERSETHWSRFGKTVGAERISFLQVLAPTAPVAIALSHRSELRAVLHAGVIVLVPCANL